MVIREAIDLTFTRSGQPEIRVIERRMSEQNGKAANNPVMRASAADVAREAGVSVSAVSRAFTPGASVSARMRNRVLVAAEKLNYVPNAMARSLMTQRTHLVGIILSNFRNPIYLTILALFTRTLQQRGLRVLLLNVPPEDDLEATSHMVMQYGIDALIVSAGAISPLIADKCAKRNIPLVAFARSPRGGKLHVVSADNVAGGRIAARQFIDAGHRNFGMIAGPRAASTSADRLKGFQAELEENGFSLGPVIFSDSYTYASGFNAALNLFSASSIPTALFCANDMLAFGAMDHARHELGLSVPQELSVIGFDDMSLASAKSYNLSTVRQPLEEMVIEAVNIVEQRILSDQDKWEKRLFACSYVERKTVCPPRRTP